MPLDKDKEHWELARLAISIEDAREEMLKPAQAPSSKPIEAVTNQGEFDLPLKFHPAAIGALAMFEVLPESRPASAGIFRVLDSCRRDADEPFISREPQCAHETIFFAALCVTFDQIIVFLASGLAIVQVRNKLLAQGGPLSFIR